MNLSAGNKAKSTQLTAEEREAKKREFFAKPEVKEMSAGLEEIAEAVAVAVLSSLPLAAPKCQFLRAEQKMCGNECRRYLAKNLQKTKKIVNYSLSPINYSLRLHPKGECA